jgi:hypothetical protein
MAIIHPPHLERATERSMANKRKLGGQYKANARTGVRTEVFNVRIEIAQLASLGDI